MHVVLLENDPHLTLMVQSMSVQFGGALTIVSTVDEIFQVLTRQPATGLVILDGTSGRLEDLERFAGLVQRVDVPIHLIHTRQEIATTLIKHAKGTLTWIDATGLLVLRDTLRLRQLTAVGQVAEPVRKTLSDRKQAILQGLRAGLTYAGIAQVQQVSRSTVKLDVRALKREFKANTRAELLAATRGSIDGLRLVDSPIIKERVTADCPKGSR